MKGNIRATHTWVRPGYFSSPYSSTLIYLTFSQIQSSGSIFARLLWSKKRPNKDPVIFDHAKAGRLWWRRWAWYAQLSLLLHCTEVNLEWGLNRRDGRRLFGKLLLLLFLLLLRQLKTMVSRNGLVAGTGIRGRTLIRGVGRIRSGLSASPVPGTRGWDGRNTLVEVLREVLKRILRLKSLRLA
jgi:hypothetical protein